MGPIFGVTVGAAGGGAAIGYGTYAARPATPAVGDQYVCSDGPHRLICAVAGQWTITIPGTTGSWQALDAADFATGFGAPTITQVGAGVLIPVANTGAKKAANSANFRIELVTSAMGLISAPLNLLNLVASGSPQKAFRFVQLTSNTNVHVQRDTDWNVSYASTAYSQRGILQTPYFVAAAQYDGAGVSFQYSPDMGASWVTIHSEATGTAGFTCIPTSWGVEGTAYAIGYREVAL